jgi:hypothetical protein
MLFSHKAFSVQEAFKVLDADNDGTVSAAEFRECFVKNNLHMDGEFFGLPNEDDQSMFTYNELAELITPFGHHHNHRVAFYDGTFEQRETQKLAWLESLYELIFSQFAAENAAVLLKEKCQLNGELIFEEIDQYRSGYVTLAQFARWVKENCNYNLSESDLAVLQRFIDKSHSHRITKDLFTAAFCAPAINEEEEEEEEEEQQ